MDDYAWVRRERVRFRDCDLMGHVNNAVYSTYLEEARIEVLGGLADFILARVEIDFRSELRAGEEIEAKSVLIGYDYDFGQSVPLSDEVRARLVASATRASA